MNQFLGILLILNAIVVTAWWITSGTGSAKWPILLCSLAVFAGLALVLSDRLVEVSVKGIGTIKAAAEQATLDAREVADIRQRIEAQSAAVELVAKEATEARRLVDDVTRQNQEAERKLAVLSTAIEDGNNAVVELQVYTQFNSAVLAAQNDNRGAYDQLWAWSENPDYPFRQEAAGAVQTIMDQHNPAIVREGFNVPWKESVDPQKLTLAEIGESFKEAPAHLRIGILEFLWKTRKDISKKDRLAFLVDVLKTDNSLNVIEYAGRWFAQGADNKLKPLAIQPHIEWWEQNGESIE